MQENAIFVALNRFGLGARPGDVAATGANPHGWVMAQIEHGQAAAVPGVQDSATRLHLVDIFFQAKTEADKAEAQVMAAAAPPKPFPPLDRPPVKFLEDDLGRRAEQMVTSDWPVSERLAAFWANHFSVSNLRGEIAMLAVPYENEAIRPFVFTSFHDMLFATATHPAMTFYLDAASSVGPDSQFGVRHKRSVNENFAREVMELHTLGVNGGYTQQDVQQLALALTGLGLDRQDGESVFFYDRHEPGARTLLGRTLADNTDQLRDALGILANHPATIRHICRKLAAHVCGDTPPEPVIHRLAAAWTASGGAFPAIYKALASAPEAWVPQPVKYRTPQDFVIAAGRAFSLQGGGFELLEDMKILAHEPYAAPAPTGWSDQDSDWIGPAGVMGRVAVARRLAARVNADADAAAVLPQVVDAAADFVTFDVVLTEINPRNAVALLLASPEFQRR